MATRLLRAGEIDDVVGHLADVESFRKAHLGPHGVEGREGSSLGQSIVSVLLDELRVLVHGVTGLERDFLVHWARRFELRNLKSVVRGKMADLSNEAIRVELVDMGPFATLPTESLLETDDVAELLRRLERTAYANVARHARLVYEERNELFAIDATLDKRYYTELCHLAARIDADHAPLFHELLGIRMDRVNLAWLLRCRFSYELPPLQTSYLLAAGGGRLGIPVLQVLTELESFSEVLRNLPEPLRSKLKGAVNAFEVTLRMENETRHVARAALATRFSFTPAFAYLLLREGDLRRVRAVVEASRLMLAPAATREALGPEDAALPRRPRWE
jgi:V/A-type H+-transporting ATPase subunit C